MFTITYERSYYGERDPHAQPPALLVQKAEALIPMLKPDRPHLYCATPPGFALYSPPLNTSIGWYIRYEPKETR